MKKRLTEKKLINTIIEQFIKETCSCSYDKTLRTKRKILHERYVRWSHKLGFSLLQKQQFYKYFNKHFELKKSDGIEYYLGIIIYKKIAK